MRAMAASETPRPAVLLRRKQRALGRREIAARAGIEEQRARVLDAAKVELLVGSAGGFCRGGAGLPGSGGGG